MSHIIDRLKKLEQTVMSKPQLPGIPQSHASRVVRYSSQRSGRKLILVFIAVIAFGVTGYIAGISSQRGNPSDHGKGKSTVSATAPQNGPFADAETHEIDPSVATNDLHTTTGTVTEEIHVAVSEMKKTHPLVPPLARKHTEIPASEDHLVARQGRLVLGKSGESESAGSSDRATALAAAIIKATDEPITGREELLNKKTILRFNILGVVKEDDQMIAIISGESYKEGDKICQFTIEEITNDYVLLSFKRRLYRKLLD
jgi:hypothetical protein